MNAYPPELVNHHYACMYVAGLLPRAASSTSQGASAHPGLATRRESGSDAQQLGSSTTVAGDRNTPSPRAQADASASEQEKPAGAVPPSERKLSGQQSALPAEAFPTLAKTLCEIFQSRGRSTAFDPAQGQSAAFHTVLTDYALRLPPRKTRLTTRSLTAAPTEESALASLPARSPLSPLHPASPLFPDGLIAPVWLRKHRELLPAVYVAFYCLAEPAKEDAGEEATSAQDGGADSPTRARVTAEAVQELKARDEELIKMISERKRILNERGIKMTVVLLTTRQMLESSALESRLSYIRRTSQLDSRASLFVLTPVTREELGEFVTSLQGALYDAALDYYRENFRRARRKRTRYPPNPSTVVETIKAAGEARGAPIKDSPLSREGWLARNSYKLGTFAEISANYEEAMVNYAVAYRSLSNDLLPSTMLLPPRTRRWAEAKVLADTLSVRISKLHLYRGNGDEAWAQFRNHVKRFTELSQGWGIGETTFEFWSWLGKQYRLMGDLLDAAMREVPGSPLPPFRAPAHFPPLPTFLLHPSHLPTPTASGNAMASYNPQHGTLATPNEAATSSGCTPALTCAEAGDCYYMAGLCALERWQRYKKMLKEEQESAAAGTSAEGEQGAWVSSSLAQEKKVDHSAQAIDALTRAHEVLKRQRRHRFSLFVASKIVNAYLDGGQHEIALRFLERIVKTCQNEEWSGPLLSQLLLAQRSSQALGDIDRQTRLLWTIVASSAAGKDTALRQAALQRLSEVRGPEVNADHEQLSIDLGPTNALFNVEFVFAKTQVTLGGAVPFQLRMGVAAGLNLGDNAFDSLRIHFGDGSNDIVIRGKSGAANESAMAIDMLGNVIISKGNDETKHVEAELAWKQDSIKVFQGTLTPSNLGTLQFRGVTLLKTSAIPYALRIEATSASDFDANVQARWLVSSYPRRFFNLRIGSNTTELVVKDRQFNLRIEVEHDDEAYLHETFACRVRLFNEDTVSLSCTLSAQVPNGTVSTERHQETTQASGELHDLSLGSLAPGESLIRNVFLSFDVVGANEVANIVVRATEPEGQGLQEHEGASFRFCEYASTLEVPVHTLITAAFSAQWRAAIRSIPSAPDDETSSASSLATAGDMQTVSAAQDAASRNAFANLNAALTIHARQTIEIQRVRLYINPSNRHVSLLRPSATHSRPDISMDDKQSTMQETEVGGLWEDGDRWGGSYDVEMLSEVTAGVPIEGVDGSMTATGHIEIDWRRPASEQEDKPGRGLVNTAHIALPLLLPPYLLSRLIVSLPAIVNGEGSFVLLVTIVNPSKFASDILIALDDSRSDFSVLSHKSFTVPGLQPRSTRSIPVQLSGKMGGVAAQQQDGSPISQSPVRVGAAAQPTLRILPSVRAWQRDRREALQAQQEELQGATAAPPEPPIVNARPGVGIPLDVTLRYTSSSSKQSQSAALQVGGLATADTRLGSPAQAVFGGDVAARLRAENDKLGAWTVLTNS